MVNSDMIFESTTFAWVLSFLSFLYQVRAGGGLPPEDEHCNFLTEPEVMTSPSLYPVNKGGEGGSVQRKINQKGGESHINFISIHISINFVIKQKQDEEQEQEQEDNNNNLHKTLTLWEPTTFCVSSTFRA